MKKVCLEFQLLEFQLLAIYILQVCDMGLKTQYQHRDSTYLTINKILALPYLPHILIEEQFQTTRSQSDESLTRLINYVKLTWIKIHYWKPEAWSVFKKAMRTNNFK